MIVALPIRILDMVLEFHLFTGKGAAQAISHPFEVGLSKHFGLFFPTTIS